MSWNKVLQEIETPIRLEKMIFQRKDKLTDEQKDKLRKAWWQIHPQPQTIDHQNPWNLAQNRAVEVDSSEDEVVSIVDHYRPDLSLIREKIVKNEKPITIWIFDQLMDFKPHSIKEFEKGILEEFKDTDSDIRNKVSHIRKYLPGDWYEIPNNPPGRVAVYQIKEKI